ncbi:MAG: MFS transporter [Bacilli bacterium]|nr:MFS transporter [Bacilli bacterium]
MAQKNNASSAPALKLNLKRTFLIGFAFFGILLLWQVYDSWCPTFLTELFKEALGTADEGKVQYLVGMMMAIDNLGALILLPIFGNLSDKTHTKIGKRMPYILVGTFCCAVAFPFIPVLFHYHSLGGTIAMMAIVVIFAMMYRNPAVALMPDITPKPLRSKANGIINIMGYIGGAFATVVGIIFVLSSYLYEKGPDGNIVQYLWANGNANLWIIEAPFLVASVLMLISALVLVFTINENKLAEELKDEMELGEKMAEVADKIDDDKPMTKANKAMLICILVAEFFWFMADNGIGTFMGNYTIYHLQCATSSSMITTIVGGLGSVLGFALGGVIASKIGRKWSVSGGLLITVIALLTWVILAFAVPVNPGHFPVYLYVIWFIKGFGMSLVHVNSFPMVVELCSSKKIGKFTGLYYASSMTAQTVTPTLLGLLMLVPSFDLGILPIYALSCATISFVVFLFIKNVKVNKVKISRGLESFDVDD